MQPEYRPIALDEDDVITAPQTMQIEQDVTLIEAR